MPGLTDAQTDSINSALVAARDQLHTPDDIGRAVVDYVLTEAASRGTFAADGNSVEVPLTARLTVPSPTEDDDSGHTKLCITAFGHEIICMEATVSSHHS